MTTAEPPAITEEAILEAFRATGLKPVRNQFFGEENEPPCGCALTALAMHRSGLSYGQVCCTVSGGKSGRARIAQLASIDLDTAGVIINAWDQTDREFFGDIGKATASARRKLIPAEPPAPDTPAP